MIQKKIHQIWLQGKDNIPREFLSNIQSIIDKNPGWEHKIWDENSILEVVASLGPQYLEKYNSFEYLHQRVDYGRYAILHNFGGVSVDIDVVALKSFDTTPYLNQSDFIVSLNSTGEFINNGTILTSKNNPIMKGFLDYILTLNCNAFQIQLQCIQSTTGPAAFTKYLEQYERGVTILDSSYFEPCSGRNKYCKLPPQAIVNHQHNQSWIPVPIKKIMEARYFCREYKWIILLLIIVIILILLLRKP